MCSSSKGSGHTAQSTSWFVPFLFMYGLSTLCLSQIIPYIAFCLRIFDIVLVLYSLVVMRGIFFLKQSKSTCKMGSGLWDCF